MSATKTENAVLTIVVTVMCCCLGQTARSAETDWPQWRGPNRDGLSNCVRLLKRWPDGGPRRLWTTDGLGDGYSTVAVVGNQIYTTGQTEGVEFLFALSTTGRHLWKREIGPGWTKNYQSARCTPTVQEGVVYAISGMGVLSCFEATSGRTIWSVDTVERFSGVIPRWGMAESVLVEGPYVFCTPGGPDASAVALDKRTGDTVWTSKGHSEPSSYCSPIFLRLDNSYVLLTMTERSVLGVDATNGNVLWTHGHVNSFRVNANTPVYHDGAIYVTSGYGKGGELLELSPDGSEVSVRWTDKTLDCHHGGVVLVDGYIYGSAGRSGIWTCLELETGKIMYEARGVGKGSVTNADGMLYCYGERGELALVPATPKEHKIVSSFRIALGTGRHWAHPVVANGRLYIRRGDTLMAYAVTAK